MAQENSDVDGPTEADVLLAQWEASCFNSGGIWHDAMVSCLCGEGRLFQIGQGCSEVQMQKDAGPLGFLQPDDPRLITSFRAQKLTSEDYALLARNLGDDPLFYLRGVTLPPSEAPEPLFACCSPVDLIGFSTGFNSVLTNDFWTPSRALVSIRQPIDSAAVYGHCLDGLAAVEEPADYRRSHRFVCAAAVDAMAELRQGSMIDADGASTRVSFSDEGGRCSVDCALMQSAVRDGYSRKFVIHMQNYVPLVRHLYIYGDDGAMLDVFLNATGDFVAADFRRIEVVRGDHLLQENHGSFGDRFEPLAQTHEGRFSSADADRSLGIVREMKLPGLSRHIEKSGRYCLQLDVCYAKTKAFNV